MRKLSGNLAIQRENRFEPGLVLFGETEVLGAGGQSLVRLANRAGCAEELRTALFKRNI